MKNEYSVKLINEDGCKFDERTFDLKKDAREFAKGRGGRYKVIIQKNPDYKDMNGYCEETDEYMIGRK